MHDHIRVEWIVHHLKSVVIPVIAGKPFNCFGIFYAWNKLTRRTKCLGAKELLTNNYGGFIRSVFATNRKSLDFADYCSCHF